MSDDTQEIAIVRHVERVLDGGFVAVDRADVSYRRSDGREQDISRFSVERAPSVGVVLVDPAEGGVWLTRQFRYPTLASGLGWIDEIAAGTVELDEEPEATARREVLEETGFTVSRLETVATFFLSPGWAAERLTLFYGKVTASQRRPEVARERADVDEDIVVKRLDLTEFLRRARLGQFDDAKTLVAGLWMIANAERLGISRALGG